MVPQGLDGILGICINVCCGVLITQGLTSAFRLAMFLTPRITPDRALNPPGGSGRRCSPIDGLEAIISMGWN